MKVRVRKCRIMIAGGGTGGHVFPAIAIANALSSLCADCQFLFVGANGRMEMERVPLAGYEIVGLPMVGMPRSMHPVRMLRFLWRWLRSNRRAVEVVTAFQPDVIVGVGGYASVPVMQAGQRAGILTVIQEQNSYAGRANRILAQCASRVYVAYDKMGKYFPEEKIRLFGNPIRASLRHADVSVEEARRELGLPARGAVVLIVGGSLGAQSLNEAVIQNFEKIRELPQITFMLQAGAKHYPSVLAHAVMSGPPNLLVYEFIERMDHAYAVADVIVSRAGAIAISELCVVGKPLILVPSPNVAEDHQTRNAEALASQGAAVLLPDAHVRTDLLGTITRLMRSPERMEQQQKALAAMAKPDAAHLIAEDILNLLNA